MKRTDNPPDERLEYPFFFYGSESIVKLILSLICVLFLTLRRVLLPQLVCDHLDHLRLQIDIKGQLTYE